MKRFLAFCFLAFMHCVLDAAPTQWGNWPLWGDQGDGLYQNPVLPADFSDLDCIRVGSDYYAISSTMDYSPGMIVIHSKDLVNWQIIGHVVNDLTQISPEYSCAHMNRPGRGIWAGAIRFHEGKYWVYFSTPDEGYFVSTALNPSGPWEPVHCVMAQRGWDDCCPFWDDNGQGYLVGTNFADHYKTWLFKLAPDGMGIMDGFRVLLNEGAGREANKLYKINGTYYHLFSEVDPKAGRCVMMQRSSSIAGPFDQKKMLSHPQPEAHEPNQGGLVQTEDGNWYFFTHHGRGDWEGRCASLLPVNWINGWPILGEVGPDGIGMMAWSGPKPVKDTLAVVPQSDDTFAGPNLGLQWEWNYQPHADRWSLLERPGFLRLHAFKPLRRDDLKTVGNMLTQRAWRTNENTVTVLLDPSGMAEGQVAGLCHYSHDSCAIEVCRKVGTLNLIWANGSKCIPGPSLSTDKIWLRSQWGLSGKSQFSYSLDGKAFTPLGDSYQLGWGDYRGDRIGLFTYNNDNEVGWADFGPFTYTFNSPSKL